MNAYGVVKIVADDGYYLSGTPDKSDSVFWEQMVSMTPTVSDVYVKEMRSNYIMINFDGDYIIDGKYVSGDLRVGIWKQISGLFVSTDGPVSMSSIDESGNIRNITLTECKFRFYTGNEDLTVRFAQKEIL